MMNFRDDKNHYLSLIEILKGVIVVDSYLLEKITNKQICFSCYKNIISTTGTKTTKTLTKKSYYQCKHCKLSSCTEHFFLDLHICVYIIFAI